MWTRRQIIVMGSTLAVAGVVGCAADESGGPPGTDPGDAGPAGVGDASGPATTAPADLSTGLEVARTPDDLFTDLPGWPFEPRYVEINDKAGGSLRVHYVEEGPAAADPILMLHGEPSWGYLYRTMIPPLVAAGHRVIVPDLVGFGRSDKPVNAEDYTYDRMVAWTASTVDALGLDRVTLVMQDWGGDVGVRLLAAEPDRYQRVVAANTVFSRGEPLNNPVFDAFVEYTQAPDFDPGAAVQLGTLTALPDDVVAAYRAPFPGEQYLAGARSLGLLVPMSTDDPAVEDNLAAWEALAAWDKPWLNAFSDGDPLTFAGAEEFAAQVPGAAGQPHTTITGAGHFLQEDAGPQLAQVIADFVVSTS